MNVVGTADIDGVHLGAGGQLFQTVKKQMEASGVRVLGAVLNKVRMKKSGYEGGYYGGYYGSYYGNYGEHHEKNA